jgi:membrane protease YdiL (CAAX protease family)
MLKLTNWIKQHQVVAFFIITFGITWGLGFTFDAVMNQGKAILSPLASVALCGPALAGIIIARISNTELRSGSSKAAWIAFLVALILSTFVFLANNIIINHASPSLGMVIFVLIMAMPVAYIISQAFSQVPSIRRHLASIVNARRGWVWLLLAVLVITGLNGFSIVLSNLLGRQSIHLSTLPFRGLTLLKMATITFFYQIFFFNLTGEEVGWRGFALPRIQARVSPLTASLILTFFWATWHAFYWRALGEPILTWQYWQDTFVRLFPATVLLNWFYNRSNGSILVAGVAHAAANTVFEYMPRIDWPVHTTMMYAFALALILIDHMWKKLPVDHPAVILTPKTFEYKREPISRRP